MEGYSQVILNSEFLGRYEFLVVDGMMTLLRINNDAICCHENDTGH